MSISYIGRSVLFILLGFYAVESYGSNIWIDNAIKSKRPSIHSQDVFHLYSHGRSGIVVLDGKEYNHIQLAYFLKNIIPKKIKHINIYACEYGKGESGKNAIDYLEHQLGISVSASDNITGIDGDWVLEIGDNGEVVPLFDYKGNLQCAGTLGGFGDGDDRDSDGICNNIDLDDDNDGISDSIECSQTKRLDILNYPAPWVEPYYGGFWSITNGLGTPNAYLLTGVPIVEIGSSGTAFKRFVYKFTTPVDNFQTNIYDIEGGVSNEIVRVNAYYNGGAVLQADYDFVLGSGIGTNAWNEFKGTSFISGLNIDPNSQVNIKVNTKIDSIVFEIRRSVNTTVDVLFGEPTFCSNRDSDYDGIFNIFDLDSDNDGCSDQVESSLSPKSVNDTTNFNTGIDADNNGHIDSFQNSTVLLSGKLSYEIATNDLMDGCLDTDNDGVSNPKDIDDDNDGVLDNDECNMPMDDSGIINGISPYVINYSGDDTLIVTSSAGNLQVFRQDGYDIINLTMNNSVYQTISYDFTAPVTNFSTVLFDVDQLEFGKVKAYREGVEVPLNASNFFLGGDIKWINEWEYTATSTSAPFTTEAIRQVGITIYQPVDSVVFYNRETDVAPRNFGNRIPSFCTNLDMDGDGIPNHLDLDSDGDGCGDEIEARANVVPANDTMNFNSGDDLNFNGLLDIFELGQTNMINYTSMYFVEAWDSLTNICYATDCDMDGVPDPLDLDSDNDGILNALESPSCFYTETEIATPIDVTSELPFTGNISNTFDDNTGTTFAFTSGTDVNGKTILEVTPITNFLISAMEIEMNVVNSFLVISPGNYIQMQGWTGTNWIDLTGYIDAPAAGPTTAGNKLIIPLSKNSFHYYKYRLKGFKSSNVVNRAIREIRLLPLQPYNQNLFLKPGLCADDFDNDNIPNYKDIDSDNDGCADDIEVGASLVATNDTVNKKQGIDANSNGLLDVYESGTSGMINYTPTYTPVLDSTRHVCPSPPTITIPPTVMPEDSTVVICPTITDTDKPNDSLILMVCGATHGTVTKENDTCIRYTPDLNYVGYDSVCVIVCDTSGLCDTAKALVTVVPKTDKIDSTICEDCPLTLCSPSKLTQVDSLKSYIVCDSSKNGELILDPTTLCLTYTPNSGYTGKDSFCILVCDTNNVCDTTIVNITISNTPDTPKITIPPTVMPEDSTVVICPTITDADKPNDSLILMVCGATHGTVTKENDTCIRYTPDLNYVGYDSVCVIVCDTSGLCDTAKALVTVVPKTDKIDSTICEDCPLTLCSPSKLTQVASLESYTVCDSSKNGELILDPTTLCLTYTPNSGYTGKDSFCILVCDTNNVCDTTIVNITIPEIITPNIPMVTIPPTVMPEDSTVVICPTITDADKPNDSLILMVCGATHGTVTKENDTCIRYTPDLNYVGYDSVCVIVCDTSGLCDTAKALVTVVPKTDKIDSTICEDCPLTLCSPSKLTQVASLESYTVCDSSKNGELILDPTTLCLTYTPNSGYSGKDSFCILVCDTNNVCDTTIVNITISNTLDTPKITIPPTVMPEDSTVVICPTITDADKPNDSLILMVCGATHGTVTKENDTCIRYTPDLNYVGYDSVCVIVCDTSGLCDTAKALVTVVPKTDKIDSTICEDCPLTLCSPSKLTQVDSLKSYIVCDSSKNGELILDPTTLCLTYTPNSGYTGKDSFCILVCDTNNVCDTTIVNIIIPEIITPNIPMVTIPPTVMPEDSTVVICPTITDADKPNDSLILMVCGATHGTVTKENDTCIRYTPDLNYVGYDSVCVIVCDTSGLCDTAKALVTVVPKIDKIDSTICEDCPLTLCSPSKLTQVASLESYTVCDSSKNGELILDPTTMCLTYTPNSGYSGKDSFCILVCDTNNVCDTTIVNITISNTLDTPKITIPPTVMPEDSTVVICPTITDADKPNDSLILMVCGATHGTVTKENDTCIRYTPDLNYVGYDSVCVIVCDTSGLCDTAKALVTVVPKTDKIDSTICEDCPLTLCSPSKLTQVASLESYTVCDSSKNGELILDPTTLCLTYTPNSGYTGKDSFCILVCDTNNVCDTTIVNITIPEIITPNTPKITIPPTVMPEDSTVVICPTITDADKPNDSLILMVCGATHGTVTKENDTCIRYTPDLNYVGFDSVCVIVCDTSGLCDTAKALVTVVPKTDKIDSTICEDCPLTLCSPSKLTQVASLESYTVCDSSKNGELILDPTTLCLTYTPNSGYTGSDSFCILVCDTNNVCDTTKVNITIPNTPDTPKITLPPTVMPEDSTVVICPTITDTDKPNDSLILMVCGATHGTVTKENDTCIRYTPDLNYVGFDSVCVIVCDTSGLCDTAKALVTVVPKTDKIDSTICEDCPLTLCSPSKLTQVASLESYIVCDSSKNGELILDPTTLCLTYTPNSGYTGKDSFCILVCDTNNVCDTTIVNITIPEIITPNIPMVTIPPTVMPEDSTVVICPTITDADRPNDSLILMVCGATHGTVTKENDTCIRYTPDLNYVGYDSVCVIVCDTSGLCDTAKALVTVVPKTDKIDSTICEDCPLTLCSPSKLTQVDSLKSYIVCDSSKNGELILDPTTLCLTYTPNSGYTGKDSFCILVCDTNNVCDTTKVNITIPEIITPNIPMVTIPPTVMPEDSTVVICPAITDADKPNDSLILMVCGATHGTVTKENDTCIRYTPDLNYVGYDSVCVIVCDTSGLCDTAKALVTVVPKTDKIDSTICEDCPLTLCSPSKLTQVASLESYTVCDSSKNGELILDPTTLCLTYTPNSGYTGKDSFCILVCDTNNVCDTTVVNITIPEIITPNIPMVTIPPTVMPEDSTVVICPTITDADKPNDSLILMVCGATHGTVTKENDTCIRYTPDLNYVGYDSVCVIVCDTSGLCDTAKALVTVVPKTDKIDSTICKDCPLTLCSPSKLTQVASLESYTVCDSSKNGELILDPTTLCLTYTPNSGYTGSDSFCILVCDTNNVCDTTKVNITIPNTPDTPKITLPPTVMPEDSTVVICPTITDADKPNDSLILMVCGATHGTVTKENDTCIRYTPDLNYVGYDSVCVIVCDTSGLCDTAKALVTVVPKTDKIDSTICEDCPLTLCSPSKLTQVDSLESYIVCDSSKNGELILDPTTMCLTYTPNSGYTGKDSFCILVCDTNNVCDTTIVNITIPEIITPNIPMVTIPPTVMPEDSTVVICPTITDADKPNDSLILMVCGATHGTVTKENDTCIRYTPDLNYVGYDSVCVIVCDTSGLCDTAKALVTVVPKTDKIDSTICEDCPLTLCSPSKLTQVDSLKSYIVCDSSKNGELILDPTTLCLTYTPNSGYTGKDSFCILVCDTNNVCDTTIVNITIPEIITPNIPMVTIPPTVMPEDSTVVICPTITDADKPNDSLILMVCGATHGTVTKENDTCIRYTPDLNYVGYDSVCVIVCDTSGLCDTAKALVTVVPKTDKIDSTICEDCPLTLCSPSKLTQVASLESYTVCDSSKNGELILDPTTLCLTYTPNSGYTGKDSFCILVCDTNNVCDTTIVNITIPEIITPNIPMVTIPPTVMPEDSTVVICPTITDADKPNDSLILMVCGANHGTVTKENDTCIRYTPDLNYVGYDSVCVIVCDTSGLCDTAKALVTVVPKTDKIDSTICKDCPLTLCSPSKLTQVDSLKSYIVCDSSKNGELILDPTTLCLTYTPNSGYTGKDSFCILVCDTNNVCDTTIVNITIPAVPDIGIILPPDTVFQDSLLTICYETNLSIVPDSIVLCGNVSNGSISQISLLCVLYDPIDTYIGKDSVCIMVCKDGVCQSEMQYIEVLPNPVSIISVTNFVKDCSMVPAKSGVDGNWDMVIQAFMANVGRDTLTFLKLTDSLEQAFGAYGEAYSNIRDLIIVTSSLSQNPQLNNNFTGEDGSSNIFIPSYNDVMEPGQSISVEFTIELNPYKIKIPTLHQFEGCGIGTVTGDTAVDISHVSTNPFDTCQIGDISCYKEDYSEKLKLRLPAIGVTKISKGWKPATSGITSNIDLEYLINVYNIGNTRLDSIQVLDNLYTQMGDIYVGTLDVSLLGSSSSEPGNVNLGFDGILDTNLLDGKGYLEVKDSMQIKLTIEVNKNLILSMGDTFNLLNSAFGYGVDSFDIGTIIVSGKKSLNRSIKSKIGNSKFLNDGSVISSINSDCPIDSLNSVLGDNKTVTDNSNASTDPKGGDIATASIIRELSLVKMIENVQPTRLPSEGFWTADVRFNIKNIGNQNLENIVISDDIAQQWGSAFIGSSSPIIVSYSPSLSFVPATNPTFNGFTDTLMLATLPGEILAPNESIEFIIQVEIYSPKIEHVPLLNNGIVSASNAFGLRVFDISDDGQDHDNLNGDNSGKTPSALVITDLGLSKKIISATKSLSTNSIDLIYEISAINEGTETLHDFELLDDFGSLNPSLIWNYIPGSVAIISETVGGEIILNPNYNGNSDTKILSIDTNFAPNEFITIQIGFSIALDFAVPNMVIDNFARANARNTLNLAVMEISQDGDQLNGGNEPTKIDLSCIEDRDVHCASDVNLVLNSLCFAEFDPYIMLRNIPSSCNNLLCVEIMNENGIIHSNTFTKEDIGKSFTAQIGMCNANNYCWGNVHIVAGQKPIDTRLDTVLVKCNNGNTILGLIDLKSAKDSIENSCLVGVSDLSMFDEELESNICDTTYHLRKILGIYTDKLGNKEKVTIFSQVYGVVPLSFSSINMPKNVRISCDRATNRMSPYDIAQLKDNPNTNVNEGLVYSVPTILAENIERRDTVYDTIVNNIPYDTTVLIEGTNQWEIATYIRHDTSISIKDIIISSIEIGAEIPRNECNFEFKFTDEEIKSCDASKYILRTWTAINTCTWTSYEYIQKIDIIDTIPPKLSEIPLLQKSGTTPWSCDAEFLLAKPNLIDNCTDIKDLKFTWDSPDGLILDNDILKLSWSGVLDTVVVKGTVTDGCGNSSDYFVPYLVIDNVSPVAIVHDTIQTTLTGLSGDHDYSNDLSKIYASSFDDGSFDVCSDIDIKVIRMEDYLAGPIILSRGDTLKVDGEIAYHSVNPCSITKKYEIKEYDKYQNEIGSRFIQYVVYDTFVKFCCEDLADVTKVQIRVRDIMGNTTLAWTSVRVGNKDVPKIICNNQTINCKEYVDFKPKAPEIVGSLCRDYEVKLISNDKHLNTCGIGNIGYNWWVDFNQDSQLGVGESITCTVDVNPTNEDNFNPYSIKWPKHYTGEKMDGERWECKKDSIVKSLESVIMGEEYECGADLKPETPSYCMPECGNVAMQYKDELISTAGACKKIIRHWTIIDWCKYVPNDSDVDDENDQGDEYIAINDWTIGEACESECRRNSTYSHVNFVYKTVDHDGYYTFDQIISIVNPNNPVIIAPDTVRVDVTLGTQSKGETQNCSAEVEIYAYAVDSCVGSPIKVANTTRWIVKVGSEIHKSIGSEYSLKLNGVSGETKIIEWVVSDPCDKKTSAKTIVIFVDSKKPTPVCIKNISTSLMENGVVSLWTSDFDRGSFDNCSDVSLSFDSSLVSASIDFSCDDIVEGIGLISRKLYVRDHSGNIDFCEIEIKLNDNLRVCKNDGENGNAMIGGHIYTELNQEISNVEVLLNEKKQMTLANGNFLFENNQLGGYYRINGFKEDNPLNGVTVLDLLKIQRHILGISDLSSPYKIIASDVNEDNEVNIADIVELRRWILGINSENTHHKTWKFIDLEWQAKDEYYPFPVLEGIEISKLNDNKMDANMIGIKLGDVTNDVKLSNDVSSRISNNLTINVMDKRVKRGEEFIISFLPEANIEAIQLSLLHNGLELLSTSLLYDEVYNRGDKTDIIIYQSTLNKTKGFEVKFKANVDGVISELLGIGNHINAIAYTTDEMVNKVALEFYSNKQNELKQNVPNPFSLNTEIEINLYSLDEVKFEIFDLQGKLIYLKDKDFAKGKNIIRISNEDLIGYKGVMYYSLTTGQQRVIKKMVKIE